MHQILYNESQRTSRVGLSSTILFLLLSGVAAVAGLWKLLSISWTAFAAMAVAIPLGAHAAADQHPRKLVWGYGLSSGAMITSAAVFLVPEAIEYDPTLGGLGIAIGVITGFIVHTASHQLTHTSLPLDHTTTELTVHALADGSIIGLIYAAMPELGMLVGLGIVSHKGPAGYAAAHRLKREGTPVSRLLLPASAVGLAGLLAGLLDLPGTSTLNGLTFGFATGVFLHVAMDFLPRCELGSEIHQAAGLEEDEHYLLDQLRLHAVLSTLLGGFAVFAAWLVLNS